MRVPCTAANLGPGFDCLGLALSLYNTFEVRVIEGRGPAVNELRIIGEGAGRLPEDETNVVCQSFFAAYQQVGRAMPRIALKTLNRIPLARGLGSSSAAIAGGLVAANFLMGAPLSREQIVALAAEMEGHPDNAAPAVLGGLCLAVTTPKERHQTLPRRNKVPVPQLSVTCFSDLPIFRRLTALAVIPNFELATAKSRSVLPGRVSREDAVFNAGRAGLMMAAFLTGRPGLLAEAMEDRLHQPYRESLVPGLSEALVAARQAGAWGACLSGAGPTILTLCPQRSTAAVGRAVGKVFSRHRIRSQSLPLRVDLEGAQARALPA